MVTIYLAPPMFPVVVCVSFFSKIWFISIGFYVFHFPKITFISFACRSSGQIAANVQQTAALYVLVTISIFVFVFPIRCLESYPPIPSPPASLLCNPLLAFSPPPLPTHRLYVSLLNLRYPSSPLPPSPALEICTPLALLSSDCNIVVNIVASLLSVFVVPVTLSPSPLIHLWIINNLGLVFQ